MMFCDFQTETSGKWILAGEHAVVRGHPALVYPLKARQFHLTYQYTSKPFSLYAEDEVLYRFTDAALKQALKLLHLATEKLCGHMDIQSTIPIGAGMGASAALCVALARWLKSQDLLDTEICPFAQKLEDYFHGKSSGLDIAGVTSDTALFFQQGQTIPIHQSWQPYFLLSYCGQKGLTGSCISTVHTLWKTNPKKAESLDKRMHEAVLIAKKSLETHSLDSLKEAFLESLSCFEGWGLINEPLKTHMQTLLHLGAIATKPTGSGNGGYVVSLWNDEPVDLPFEVIRISCP